MINHLKRLDWQLLGAVGLVFVMGLAVFYASGADEYFFWRQALFGVLGLALAAALSFFDWRLLKTSRFLVLGGYVLGLVLLVVLLIAGPKFRGVSSWFRVGDFNFEPVEPVKVILAAMLAKYFSMRHAELYRWKHIAASGFYAALPAALVLVQPDLGSAAILVLVWCGLVLVSGIKAKQFFWLAAAAVVCAGLLWNFGLADYQKNRITSFVYPERDPLGGAYQSTQAVIAVGSGGFEGKGLGQGTQTRLGFLPEHETDFIFAAIAEEWGFLGVMIFLGAWGVIFFRLYKVIQTAPDNFSRLFTAGFTIILSSHFIINIGANLGFLPITGLPLGFVSYGGSNLAALSAGLGVVQAIKARVFRPRLADELLDL